MPDDAITHLATVLGIMAGDTYDQPGEPPPPDWETHGFGREELAQSVQGGPQAEPDGTAKSSGDWIADVLKAVGAPDTPENRKAMDAWQRAEGPEGPGRFNWLNTTRNAPGAQSINSVGVKRYVDYDQGLQQTIQALTNGLYGNVIAALKQGNDAHAVANAVAGSKWGTGQGVNRVLSNG